jgi:hypothetical protein
MDLNKIIKKADKIFKKWIDDEKTWNEDFDGCDRDTCINVSISKYKKILRTTATISKPSKDGH